MKYLKLYENFNNNQDDIEEILWILRDIDNDSKLIINELDGNLLLFKVERPNTFNTSYLLEPLERLEVMDYKMVQYSGDDMLIVNLDYFENTSPNAVLLKYLMDKYGDLKHVIVDKDTYKGNTLKLNDINTYVDTNDKTIFTITNKIVKGDEWQICYLDNNLYEFLYKLTNLKFDKFKSLITDWLNQSYGLKITNLRSAIDLI